MSECKHDFFAVQSEDSRCVNCGETETSIRAWEYVRRIMQLQAENARLRKKYQEAIYDIGDWGSYAPEYFKEKHGLEQCIAEHTAALQEPVE